MISPKTVQLILDTARIEDVVQDYVQLKRSGANYKGLCPFHQEKTPSFVVSPAKNLCKCFGCGKGGSPVGFLMEHDQLSYPEALRSLAQRYNIAVEEIVQQEPTDEEREERKRQESLLILNDFAARFYQQQLVDTEMGQSVGLNYFKERGFLVKTIETFGLGYAPKGPTSLLDKAEKEGYQPELLKELGLLNSRGQDFFKNRVIFPIHDKSGKPIAFAGRIMGSTQHTKAPKYINSPETPVYNKSESLYGLFQARQAIRKEQSAILVEGYTDVLSLHQAGIENVVASSGTSLTRQQVSLIRRLTDKLIILYDGDAAGVKAALRGISMVLDQGMDVTIAVLPEGQDPDGYVQKEGTNNMRTFLQEEAQDVVLFQVDVLLKESQTPAEKAAALDTIIETLSHIPDVLKRSLYVQECAAKFGINEQIVHDKANKYIVQRQKQQAYRQQRLQPSKASAPQVAEQPANETVVSEVNQTEREIARVLICFGTQAFDESQTIAEFLLSQIEEVADEFDELLYGRIVHEYLNAQKKNRQLSPQYFSGHAEEAVRKLATDVLQSPYDYSPNWEKRYRILLQTQKMPEENYIEDAKRVLLYFKENKFQQMRHEIVEHLKMLETKEQSSEISIYLKALLHISQKMQTLSQERTVWR